MELLQHLAMGFSILANPMTILYSLTGVVCGVIIGALPVWAPPSALLSCFPCATVLIPSARCACCAASTTGPCTAAPLPRF